MTSHHSLTCLDFPKHASACLAEGEHRNLTTLVNKQISEEVSLCEVPPSGYRDVTGTASKPASPDFRFAKRVSSKLEDGDFRGAVRLACSEDVISDYSDTTFRALELKHPPPHQDSNMLECDVDNPLPFSIDRKTITNVIASFPNASGGDLMVCAPNIRRTCQAHLQGMGGSYW